MKERKKKKGRRWEEMQSCREIYLAMNVVTPVPKLGARYLVRPHLPVTSCLSWKDAHLFFSFYRFAFGSTKQTRRNALQKAQSNTIDLVGHNAKYGGASTLIGGALLNYSSSSSLWCGRD